MVKDLVTVERDEDGLLKFFVVWQANVSLTRQPKAHIYRMLRSQERSTSHVDSLGPSLSKMSTESHQ